VVFFPRSQLFAKGRSRIRTSSSGDAVADFVAEAARPSALPNPDEAARHAVLLSIGDLTTRTAAADLLECAISLAEASPWQPLSIAWIGDGDLRGVLKAQPLPEMLSQHFVGKLPEAEAADKVASADVLCFVGRARSPTNIMAAVRMTGMPVIGCIGNENVAQLIRDGQVGWLFEDRRPASIMAALSRALDAHTARLARIGSVGIKAIAEQG
jgi:glycosyltransferase involved in cell wall biosynthesis